MGGHVGGGLGRRPTWCAVVVDPARYGADRVRAAPVADWRPKSVSALPGRRGCPVRPGECPTSGTAGGSCAGRRHVLSPWSPPYEAAPKTRRPGGLARPRATARCLPGNRGDWSAPWSAGANDGRTLGWSVCAVTGEGGSGKTRLASQACARRLARAGTPGSRRPLGRRLREHLERPPWSWSTTPTCTLTSSAPWSSTCAPSARAVARLLLLARHLGDQAGVGWWSARPHLGARPVFAGVLDVDLHPLDIPGRQQHFFTAFDALAPHVPAPAPRSTQLPALAHLRPAPVGAHGCAARRLRRRGPVRGRHRAAPAPGQEVSVRARVLRSLLGVRCSAGRTWARAPSSRARSWARWRPWPPLPPPPTATMPSNC